MLDAFEPYGWEPSTEQIAASLGIRPDKILRMDLNTSPVAPIASLRAISKKVTKIKVNLYPDTSYSGLRRDISDYTSHDADSIIPTNGADEAIDIVSRIFLEKGVEALASVPTYSYFRIASELQGAKYIGVPRLEGFEDNIDDLLSSINRNTGLVLLCSPNNPTGNLTPLKTVENLCRETESSIVVDEAYFEYCGVTAQPLLEKFSNLIIIRTLSKAFGLASARIGYILACAETVRLINKARPPNSLGAINIELARHALRHRDYMRRAVRDIVNERERLRGYLSRMEGLEVYPSHANFLLIRFKNLDANRVYEELLRRGIVVRNLSQNPLTRGCLRVTLGLKKQNERLLTALKSILEFLGR
ncbi:MAG: histidinol-phosphate transaminase [Nitrososphaerota archaeon]|nr:histidinol-phosphate transaminase [Nitrososphaerota archaeon]